MWLSKQIRSAPPSADADLGVTSIAGGAAGVLTRGEVRRVPVFGPGGYIWQPRSGETVLVIKGGPGGEETCVAGAAQRDAPPAMKPGEVYLYAPGGASVYLKSDGSLELSGSIRLRGSVQISGELTINGHGCNAAAAQ